MTFANISRLLRNRGNITAKEKDDHAAHILEKNAMRDARNIDKEGAMRLVIEFDLENVIPLPKSEISCCSYKRKLRLSFARSAIAGIKS